MPGYPPFFQTQNRTQVVQMKRHKRYGSAALEVVMAMGSLFVLAVVFYWLAQDSYVGLYQLISIQIGSPYF